MSEVGKRCGLLVMGGGMLEKRDNRYYGKVAVIRYLHELSDFYHEVNFAALEHEGCFFSTPLDTARVKPYLYKQSRNLAFSLFDDIRQIATLARKKHVIVWLPGTWHLILFPFVSLSAEKVALYIACDWEDESLRLGTSVAMNFAIRSADIVFARGHTRNMALKYNENVWESHPIIPDFGLGRSQDAPNHALRQTNTLRLLTVCTLVERKGMQYVLRAVHELASRLLRPISLGIVGDGPERESLEQQVEDLGIGDLVVFHGYVDDPQELSKLYLNSDIFVFHSFHEGQPRVLDEASIHGLPIVATDLPGIQMNFHHQRSALLYEPGAYLDLVECICRLARSEKLATHLATNARQDFYRRFEFRSAAEQHASLLIQEDLK